MKTTVIRLQRVKKRTVILSLMTKIIRGNVRLQFYDCAWYDHETVSKWLYELSNFKSVELWKSWNMDITKFDARFSWYKILRFNKNLSSLAFRIEILFNIFKFVRNCFFFLKVVFKPCTWGYWLIEALVLLNSAIIFRTIYTRRAFMAW